MFAWVLLALLHTVAAVSSGDEVDAVDVVTTVAGTAALGVLAEYMSGTWFTPSAPLAAAETRKERMAPPQLTEVSLQPAPSHSHVPLAGRFGTLDAPTVAGARASTQFVPWFTSLCHCW